MNGSGCALEPGTPRKTNFLVASREPTVAGVTNQAAGKRTPPVNLSSASVPVQSRIRNLMEWAYGTTAGRNC